MNTTVRRSAVVVFLVFTVACGNVPPTSPSKITPPTPPPSIPPPNPLTFPPLSGPSRTLIYDEEESSPASNFTKGSRFVLYDNGAFVLQYPPSIYGDGAFRGQDQSANGVLMFLFEFSGRSVGTPFDDATATLRGDSLTVQYKESMQHADFENAVYVLAR